MGFYTLAGSHCSNHNYWSGPPAYVRGSKTTIIIKNKSDSCYDCCGNHGNIWGGYGKTDKYMLTGLGIGVGVGLGAGLLTSPLGGTIMKGIGTGFKYTGRTLWEGGKALVNTFCWAGKGIYNGARMLFGREPVENNWETFEMKNPFRAS